MNQLSLYLPSDCWMQEYECFELLYLARCVQGAAVDWLGCSGHEPARVDSLPPCTERVA